MLTNGYDYAFALSTDEVNSILKNNLTGKKIEVKYAAKDADSGSTINIDCNISPWKITGGGGTLITYSMPIAEGYMSIEGGALPSNSYDLTGISVILNVSLGWLGTGTEQQASGSGDTDKLIFSPSTKNKNNPGYVFLETIIDPTKQLDAIGKGVLTATFVDSLIDNKAKLEYIFANVNPTPAKVASWLKPIKWQYYFVGTKSGNSALTFLCQLSQKPFPQKPTFDANNLDKNNNSLLLLSQETFFDNVVLPSVKKSFSNGTFVTSVNEEEAVTLSNKGNFSVGKVTAFDFKLTQSQSGNGLAISVSGGGPLKFFFGLGKLPNASYSWGISAVNPLIYKNGNISFGKDPSPAKTHNQTIHWYDWLILVLVGISDIAGLVAAIVDGIDGFYDDSESMGIGNINDEVQASTDGTVVNLTNLIDWKKSGEKFSPSDAGLNVSFFVRGNLSE